MKKILSTFVTLLLTHSMIGQATKPKTTKPNLNKNTQISAVKPASAKMDTIGYSFGVLIAQQFIQNKDSIQIDGSAIAKGFQDAMSGKPQIDVMSANQIFGNYMNQMSQKKYTPIIEEGKKFLADNAKRPGVKVTPSGLQYEVLVEGTGDIPKLTDKVTTHYHGTLLNGEVFDSSVQRGQPIDFPVNGVISGWTEALQMMKVGSKWKLFIPYNLAYGERGAGGSIGPYSTLIFEVELLKIN